MLHLGGSQAAGSDALGVKFNLNSFTQEGTLCPKANTLIKLIKIDCMSLRKGSTNYSSNNPAKEDHYPSASH